MNNIIQYFSDICIKNFIEIQEELFKEPKHFAEVISGLEEELRKLGIKIIQETLEEMDSIRRRERLFE